MESEFNEFNLKPRSSLDAAQDIIYVAWEAETSQERIRLAKKALEKSPDCADAYVILANESAKTLDDAIELYGKGVEAGERALGKKTFKEDVGNFWGILETRPYMRARQGLAQSQWEIGQRDEAISHYKDMLRLNPDDNQGIRDMLITCLLELGLNQDAAELYKTYSEDCSALWAYSSALLNFRNNGESAIANKSLRNAFKTNKHVVDFLLGRKNLPVSVPEYYSPGGEDEAVLYVIDNKAVWEATSGALKWLTSKSKATL